MEQAPRLSARTKLLEAAVTVVRQKGFAATTVDDLCAAAGVTKGAFFHHFRTKDDLGIAAADHWNATTAAMFAAAAYHRASDPFDRVMGYLDLRVALLCGTVAEFTCLVGTLVQEVHMTAPGIAAAGFACMRDHARTLEADLALLIAKSGTARGLTAAGLALHTQAVLQGAFILAKGQGDADAVRDAVGHLRHYLRLLFSRDAEGAACQMFPVPVP